MNFRKTAMVIVLMLSIPSLVYAAELPVLYKGIRPQGMGGAFTAIADDENAMFYNPAGLDSIKGFGGAAILNPYIEASRKINSFYRDLKDIANESSDTEQANLAAQFMQDWLDKHMHLRSGLFPNVTFHDFGIGVLGQVNADGEVQNVLGEDTLFVRGVYDLALIASAARGFDLFNNPLKVGITGKLIYQQSIDQSYTTTDLVQNNGIDLREGLNNGTGIGIDMGAIYSLSTVSTVLEPTLGLTVLNIGDVDMGDAGTLEQQLNLGGALKAPVGSGKLLLALDVMDLTSQLPDDEEFWKKVHAGAELHFPILLSIRAGVYQGYPSYGFTVDLKNLKASYAFYVEQLGPGSAQNVDRRNMIQIALGF
jgi:hypothetical protein